MKKLGLLIFSMFILIATKVAYSAPVIDVNVTDNGDSTYTYDLSVTNNNSGNLYFFGIDIDHITYELNGWSSSWMGGSWSNVSYGGANDPFGTAWIGGNIAQGDTLSGFSFTSYDLVSEFRWFAWNEGMSGIEDANLFNASSNNGWEYANSKVSAVPIPAAVFLFAPAMLGLMGFRRRLAQA